MVLIFFAFCFAVGRSDGDWRKNDYVLDLGEVSDKIKCSKRMFDETEKLSNCSVTRPFTYALRETLLFRNVLGRGRSCVDHTNSWFFAVSGKEKPKNAPMAVRGCCVNVCLINITINEYVLGYFVSGSKELGAEGGLVEQDDRCKDCWGVMKIWRWSDNGHYGGICKRGESWFVHYGLPENPSGEESDDPDRFKGELLSAENLPWCKRVTFDSAEGSAEPPPKWIYRDSVPTAEQQPSEPAEETDGPETHPSTENNDGDCKSVWTWLGPAILSVFAALIAGVCGIIGMMRQQGIVIKAEKTSCSHSDVEVR